MNYKLLFNITEYKFHLLKSNVLPEEEPKQRGRGVASEFATERRPPQQAVGDPAARTAERCVFSKEGMIFTKFQQKYGTKNSQFIEKEIDAFIKNNKITEQNLRSLENRIKAHVQGVPLSQLE